MIPKIIHYCWFGHNPKPELAEKCISSWKQFLPGYEIKEWNEIMTSTKYLIQHRPIEKKNMLL